MGIGEYVMATAMVIPPVPIPEPQHPLRERNFLMLFLGSTISIVGDQCYFVAMPWLVLQQTGSAIAMGTIMMSGAIPRAVLMLMGGAVSDRTSPRKVMMMTAWARAILVTALGFAIWSHLLHTWQLYAVAAAFGTADAFDNPAGQAFIPFLVKSEQLVAAESVTQVRTLLATIIGPTPAGFVINSLGLASAFFIDAVSFLFIIAALFQLPDPPPAQKKPTLQSILEGLQYIGKDVPLRSLMLVAVGINFCLAGPISLGLAFTAKTKFGSPAILGVMLSSLAGGALSGALLAGIWKIRRRGILILVVALVLGLLLCSLAMLKGRWTIPATLALMGISAGMANVQIGAWIMQRVDQSVRGRVMSVLAMGAVGAAPLSMALAGLLIAVSLKLMFLMAGSLMLLVTLAAATQRTVRQIE
jgi:MFS family permease